MPDSVQLENSQTSGTPSASSDTVIMDSVTFPSNEYWRRDSLLTHLQALPVFTGTDPTFSLHKFKSKFLTIAKFLNWSPDEQLFALQQRVAGQAQTVLLNLNEEIKEPNDIFKILADRFEVNQDTASLLNAFWSFKQDTGTPVKEFVALAKSKVKTLVARQKVPETARKELEDDWMLSMMLKNLLPHLRKAVITKNPQNVDELIAAAVLEEKACLELGENPHASVPPLVELTCSLGHELVGERKNSQEETMFMREIKKQIGDLAQKVENLKISNVTPMDKNSVQCFRCFAFGHVQNVCPLNFFQNNQNFAQQNFNGRRNYTRGRGNYSRGRGRNFYRPPRTNYGNGRNFYQEGNVGSQVNQSTRGNSENRGFRGNTGHRNSRGRNNARGNRQSHVANSNRGTNQSQARQNVSEERTQGNVTENLNSNGPR